MEKSWKWIVCGLVLVGAAIANAPQAVQARPGFTKAFQKMYPALDISGDNKCNVCHFGDKKSNINDYGTAIGKVLGAKNVKETDKIEAALKKTEEEPSSVEGKTFGDLIRDGKLPGKEPAKPQ